MNPERFDVAIVGRTADDLRRGEDARERFERLGGNLVALDQFEGVEGECDPLFETSAATRVRPD